MGIRVQLSTSKKCFSRWIIGHNRPHLINLICSVASKPILPQLFSLSHPSFGLTLIKQFDRRRVRTRSRNIDRISVHAPYRRIPVHFSSLVKDILLIAWHLAVNIVAIFSPSGFVRLWRQGIVLGHYNGEILPCDDEYDRIYWYIRYFNAHATYRIQCQNNSFYNSKLTSQSEKIANLLILHGESMSNFQV